MDELMNDWISEWMNQWMNQWMNKIRQSGSWVGMGTWGNLKKRVRDGNDEDILTIE